MHIHYPDGLVKKDKIGVTALSSGVEEPLHLLLQQAKKQVELLGYQVVFGDTIWQERQARSAPKEKRAQEFMAFYQDPQIKAIIPPWGGDFVMEVLPLINWHALRDMPPKWLLGYSDISTFNFVYTMLTGNASAHGINFNEMSAPQLDKTSLGWHHVLTAKEGDTIHQVSSEQFQSSWEEVFRHPATGFYPDTKTEWKSNKGNVRFSGRLLGGTLNTIQLLHGTPFDQLHTFMEDFASEDGIVWYFESVGMSAADMYRAFWQMKVNGWFAHTNGVLIGRLNGYQATKDYQLLDVLQDIFSDIHIPFIYDVDVGHMPPQVTLVNGALATITYQDGAGEIELSFV
ncbi:S66 family peptidase [Gracilibacillus phocaeensis]|uniref:S66 family peptidase n=1 Tax=Gracilibacillus phocaeensis TaxID=2042304 RepID=UPI0010301CD8|nr:S66 peptidase family protein [Gracilibacillus phocaeensis]